MFLPSKTAPPSVLTAALRGAWSNRGELGWALDVLRHGLCGECSLGTHGWRDELLPGMRLCSARMEGLSRWTAGTLDLPLLEDVSALSQWTAADLRGLGRLAEPVIWRCDQPGFVPLSWEDALKLTASRIQGAWGLGFNPTELSNEAMFCLSELASSGGASVISSPLSWAQEEASRRLRQHFGGEAATGNLEDLECADLVLLAGCDLRSEPLLGEHLERVIRAGGRVVEVEAVQPGVEGDRAVVLVGPGVVGNEGCPEDSVWLALQGLLTTLPNALFIPVGWPPGWRGACDLGLRPGPLGEATAPAEPVGSDRSFWFQAGSLIGATAAASSFRVHQLLDLDPSVLVPASEAVLLLPMQSRFEMEGGGTYSSLVGRVRFSPEIRGHQIGSARPDWWVASQLLSHLEGGACGHEDGDAVRRSLAQLRPAYAGSAELFAAGESFQTLLPSERLV